MYALMPWLHEYRVLARPEHSESQPFLDAENQHPASLQYISVHNLFPGANRESIQNDSKKTNVQDDYKNTGPKNFSRTAPLSNRQVRFSDDSARNDGDFEKRIVDLEEENVRLKAALKEALSGKRTEL